MVEAWLGHPQVPFTYHFYVFQLLSKGNVFTTDAIAATLMTATRSVYSWDVVVQVLYLPDSDFLCDVSLIRCNSH